MKKIVPFRKEINFKTNIAEITSISLEHTLKIEDDYLIDGDFVISGEYKMADVSTNTESFNFNLPCNISIDEKYLLDKVEVDIDDFYYEIINDKTLVVNIDVLIDNLEEKPLIIEDRTIVEETKKEDNNYLEKEEEVIEEDNCLIKDENKEIEIIDSNNIEELKHPIIIEEPVEDVSNERNVDTSIFNSFTEKESIATYRVYIVREGDMIDGIIEKYGITKESLEKYNNLNDVKIGDKLIIPSE